MNSVGSSAMQLIVHIGVHVKPKAKYSGMDVNNKILRSMHYYTS